MRRLVVGIVILAALFVTSVAMTCAFQSWVFYPRGPLWKTVRTLSGHPLPHPENLPGLEGLQKIWIDIPGGQVEGWFLPGAGVSAKHPGPLVMFVHGTGELIDDWPALLLPYRNLGISVLLPEYRGYGRSTGNPTQETIEGDMERFYDAMVRRPDVDPHRIIFHGKSLGGAILVGLSTARHPAAMILQSTFTSMADVTRRLMVPKQLIKEPYSNIDVASDFDWPVLILHCRRDWIVPYSHALRMHQAIADSRLVSFGTGHNQCPGGWVTEKHPTPTGEWDLWWNEVGNFLRTVDVIS